VVVIEERRDEIIVAERPEPAAFSDNRNVEAIYFDFDRYDIRPNDAQMLEVDAAWLKTNDMLILVEGQCDERGTAECNLALGDRRAQAAKNYLVALGISASRIGTVSYGKERPVCAEHTEDCWAANRRGNGLRGVRLFRLGARLHEAGRLHTLTRALRWTVRNEAARCTPPTGRHVRTYEPSTPHPIV